MRRGKKKKSSMKATASRPLRDNLGVTLYAALFSIALFAWALDLAFLIPVFTFGILVFDVSKLFSFKKASQAQPEIKKRKAKNTKPPSVVEGFVFLVLGKEEREYIIGDMEESYSKWVSKRGVFIARLLYCRDAVTTVWPRAQRLWFRLLKVLTKIGFIGLVSEFFRRISQ